MSKEFKRIPQHIGIIPDGNRRWALSNNYEKHDGYRFGVTAGYDLYELLLDLGVKEATFYGFTKDNTKRAKVQKDAFVESCIQAVKMLANRDANLLVLGNTESTAFPKELLPYANKKIHFGKGLINLNFLVNYDWEWDLSHAFFKEDLSLKNKKNYIKHIASAAIPRIDMIIRWGGRSRLSGFLPVQSIYSDIYVLEENWPDFNKEQLYKALEWYQTTDVTLGG